MPMKKVVDWRKRLSDEIERHRRMPFDEAQNNCGLFIADCLIAMTGVDFAAHYRGKFTTLAEAIDLLKADGFSDLCAFAAARLTEIHPVRATAGDIAAFETQGTGWAFGIINGEMVTVMTERGLGNMRKSQAVRAFRI
jgi:hypothetical protein